MAVHVAADEEHDAEAGQHDGREPRRSCTEAERRSARCQHGAGADEGERPHDCVREADTSQREDRRPHEEDGANDPPLPRRLRVARCRQQGPGARIRDEACAEREREEREHQPNKRRVDRERFSDAAADSGEHPAALHARDARERNREPQRTDAHPRCTSSWPSPTRASSTSTREGSLPTLVTVSCAGRPSWVLPNRFTSPALTRPLTWTVTERGTCTTRSPMPSVALTCVVPTGT